MLDEADRMLDMGFWPDVRKIVSALPAVRQTLLFSATTSSDVVMLAEQVMRDPRFIQIGRAGGPATTIAHIAHMMPAREKVEWLTRFLRRTHAPSLIFVRTKRGADQLASSLASRGVRCAPLHADRTQKERSAAVEGFRSGRHTALVATDIAARGLDIDGIAHVINYEVPHSAKLVRSTASAGPAAPSPRARRSRSSHPTSSPRCTPSRSRSTSTWTSPSRRRLPGAESTLGFGIRIGASASANRPAGRLRRDKRGSGLGSAGRRAW